MNPLSSQVMTLLRLYKKEELNEQQVADLIIQQIELHAPKNSNSYYTHSLADKFDWTSTNTSNTNFDESVSTK